MKKLIIISAALLVFIGFGYLIYSNLMIRNSPCASIFGQTTVSLEEKINILKNKAGAILGKGQIQKLSDQSDQITADLKTCCILFHDEKIAFEEFLNCQDDFSQYESSIDRLAHLVAAAQAAKQQERKNKSGKILKQGNPLLPRPTGTDFSFGIPVKTTPYCSAILWTICKLA